MSGVLVGYNSGMGPPLAPVVVRALGGEDSIAELTGFLHRAYAALAARGLRYVATHQDEATTIRRIRGGECYLALLDGQLAGTITFHDAARTSGCSWYDRPEVSSFHQFAVEPELQGRGIGSMLLERVELRAAETGAEELALDTAVPAVHLIRYYERRGYRVVENVDFRPVTNYPSVVLSKRLTRAG